MDGVRSYASRPRDDTLLGRNQNERSGTEYRQRFYGMPLQAVGISISSNQMGSPFRESSSAADG